MHTLLLLRHTDASYTHDFSSHTHSWASYIHCCFLDTLFFFVGPTPTTIRAAPVRPGQLRKPRSRRYYSHPLCYFLCQKSTFPPLKVDWFQESNISLSKSTFPARMAARRRLRRPRSRRRYCNNSLCQRMISPLRVNSFLCRGQLSYLSR